MDPIREILKEQTIDYIMDNYPNFKSIINSTESEIKSIPGLTNAKAKQFYGFLQLSRLLLASGEKPQKISSPADIYENLKEISLFEEERFFVILLNTKNVIISHVEVSKGSLNATLVHPREVFAPAVRMKANSIIVVHNHPSGNTTPSNEDISITNRLIEVGNLLGIKLLDHIIIGGEDYLSLKEKGLI